MTVNKLGLNERFLKTCNGFCNAKHKLAVTQGMATRILNACFAEVLF